MNIITKYLNAFEKIDKISENPDIESIRSNIIKSISTGQDIQLISFTCSTINSQNMFNPNNPESYISTDPAGNNLEADINQLNRIYSELRYIYETNISIIIGNTDPFYIYSQEVQAFPQMSESEYLSRFSLCWNKYEKNFTRWIDSMSGYNKYKVVNWYKLESNLKELDWDFRKEYRTVYSNISSYFSRQDLDWELKKLNNSFGDGKYFEKTPKPDIATLEDWVKRKFAEYAVQGYWIKKLWPNGILIQNEKPTELRYKMYQPLIIKEMNSTLPNIFLFGVDNVGYQ